MQESNTPLIEVSHLPSAASFYATLVQPLGLHFLFASPIDAPDTCLHFGFPSSSEEKETVFCLKQASPLKVSTLSLAVSSPEVVTEFHGNTKTLYTSLSKLEYIGKLEEQEVVARVKDIDGNMLQTAYHPSSRGHGGRRTTIIETQSTDKEARRVLAWQHDVARSVSLDDSQSQPPPPPIVRRDSYPPHSPSSAGAPTLVRREIVTTERHTRRSDGGSGNEGLSSKALIGTLLGAAAGAAVAYAMVRSESPERISAAHSGRHAGYAGSSYTYGNTQRIVERVPVARSQTWVSERDARPRYVAAAPPSVLERIEERSRHSSHRRSRSEVGSRYEHRPLAILPARDRSPGASHVSRKSSGTHKSHHSLRHGGDSHHSSRPEREGSYHTARSIHTASTIKAMPANYVTAPPSKISTVRVVEDRRSVHPSQVELPLSVVTPRSVVTRSVHPSQIELPRSVVGGRGYAASVAPSDSVSSIGSKRERERLIARMVDRERASERW